MLSDNKAPAQLLPTESLCEVPVRAGEEHTATGPFPENGALPHCPETCQWAAEIGELPSLAGSVQVHRKSWLVVRAQTWGWEFWVLGRVLPLTCCVALYLLDSPSVKWGVVILPSLGEGERTKSWTVL